MSAKQDRLTSLRAEKHLLRWERRREMIALYTEGYKFSDFADELGKKYGISYDALERDWCRRKKWLPVLAKIDKPKLHVQGVVLRMHRIAEVAWETYRSARTAKNHNAMVGAVEKLIRITHHEVDILQSLGILSKEPEKIDALITSTGPMPWQEIPEVQEGLKRIREKLRAEKAASSHEPST